MPAVIDALGMGAALVEALALGTAEPELVADALGAMSLMLGLGRGAAVLMAADVATLGSADRLAAGADALAIPDAVGDPVLLTVALGGAVIDALAVTMASLPESVASELQPVTSKVSKATRPTLRATEYGRTRAVSKE